jgi:subtilisin family serine protease
MLFLNCDELFRSYNLRGFSMLQILTIMLISMIGWSLLAADQFMIKAKTQTLRGFSALRSVAPMRIAELSDAEARRLREQGFVVEKNYPIFIADAQAFDSESRMSSPSPDDGMIWPALAMKLDQAHALPNSKGEDQVICVVDTGVDATHPLFAQTEIMTYNTIDDTNVDGQGHGTFVASLALGLNPSAPAPAAKLIAVKALDDNGGGTYADVIEAIQYCSDKSSVINLSLGASQSSEIMHEVIQEVVARGVTVVAAAANSGDNNVVIAVGSVDKNLAISRFSSFSAELDFVAPGDGVGGAALGGGTKVMSGNSMATGYVSGLAALQKSRNSRGILADDLGYPAEKQGAGLVNALSTALNQ